MKQHLNSFFQHPILLFGIPAGALITCVFPLFYPLTVLQSLALQGFGFLLCFTLILLFFKKFTAFAFSLLCLISIGVSIFPHLPSSKLAENEPISDFTIAQFNVDFRDGDYQKMLRAIVETDADLVSCQEVSEAWAYELEKTLTKKYPHYRIHFEYNMGRGMAVFSKYPFQSLGKIRVAGSTFFLGGIGHEKGDIFFTLAHTKSPVEYPDYVSQKEQFQFLQKVFEPKPAQYRFLIGDLNAVPWSDPLESFLENTTLQDPRYELLTTFPRKYPWAGIPIDYILHSPEIRCISLEKITDLGSDHAGLFGKFVLDTYEKQSPDAKHLAFIKN